eukprot:103096-Rhodomonas_salina.1
MSIVKIYRLQILPISNLQLIDDGFPSPGSGRRDANVEAIQRAQAEALAAAESNRPFTAPGLSELIR